MEIRTDDLFFGAYALAEGAELVGLETAGWNGKRMVRLRLRGRGLGRCEQRYRTGQATANVTVLKASLTHLKDLVFAELRSAERREERRRPHAPDPR